MYCMWIFCVLTYREGAIWLAGLYEGEGCLSAYYHPERASTKTRRTWAVAIGMTDRDVVEKVKKVFGAGNVRVQNRKAPRKTFYLWRITKRSEVYYFLAMIYPWLGKRRRALARTALLELPCVPTPDNPRPGLD